MCLIELWNNLFKFNLLGYFGTTTLLCFKSVNLRLNGLAFRQPQGKCLLMELKTENYAYKYSTLPDYHIDVFRIHVKLVLIICQ